MLAKTIPITRLAVQFDRGGAGPAAVFEVEAFSPPSVTGQAYVAREQDAKTDRLHAKPPCGVVHSGSDRWLSRVRFQRRVRGERSSPRPLPIVASTDAES
jgi:hypothetical protein